MAPTGKVSAKRAGFLLSADLEGTDTRVGRRKQAQQRQEKRKAAQDAELSAEKKPRSAQKWVEEERKSTALPKTGAPEAPVERVDNIGDEKVGKKKAKRLAVIEKKKSQKSQKEAAAEQRQHAEAQEALKGKAKGAELSAAATEHLKHCVRDARGEQRLLAICAEKINGNPEKELELFDVFFELHAKGCDALTRQYALLTATAVFRDLVPGYRIRDQTEVEKAVVKSREVLNLERHEMKILQVYRRLLPVLEAAMKHTPEAIAPALAALVKAAADFNYRQRLINTAVKYASSPIESVRRVLVNGLTEMVEADQRLEACREVVLSIGNVAQAAAQGKQGTLRHELLQILLRLPVGRAQEAAMNQDGQLAAVDDEVARDLAEASITQNADKLAKAEAELLYEVFCVYLRAMRQRHVHSRELIAAALVGLAKWGQHVNLELLLEILTELKLAVNDAITQADELVSLQGLNCALVLLSGPAQAILTDATWLPDALTRALALALPSMHGAHSEAAAWPPARCYTLEDDAELFANRKELKTAMEAESVPTLVLRCVESAMKCPHGFGGASDASMVALLETLFNLSAAADAHVGLALLRESAMLLKRHRRLHTLLEAEGGLFGLGGVKDRAVSVSWQLHPLACSLAPAPAKIGQGLTSMIRSRSALLSDIFPSRDAKSWLEWEFPQHIASLLEAPTPEGLKVPSGASRPAGATKRRSVPASFCTAPELARLLGVTDA